jgi:hypothetical protein
MSLARQLPAAETSSALRLAEAWAAFSKALAIYPETNSRVTATLDALFGALAVHPRTVNPGGAVALYFQQGHVWVDGESHEVLAKTNLAWLQERMEKAVLAGVLIRPELQRDDLLRFTRDLLAHFTRTDLDLDFALLWPDAYGGLQPVERRFQGTFSGSALPTAGPAGVAGLSAPSHDRETQERLVQELSEKDAVHERLLVLQERLDAATGPDKATRSIDLVERIVALMPAEAMADANKLLELTTEVLDTLAHEASEGRGNAGVLATGDSALNNLVLTVGRRLFGRKAAGQDEGPGEATATGRDDAVTEDVAACGAEFAALPDDLDSSRGLAELELPEETLGVHLHYFVNLESLDKAKRLYPVLARSLAAGGAESLAVLASYLGTLRVERKAGGDGRKLARVLEFLRASQLTSALRACGALAEDLVIATFPLDFGLFVLSLDLALPREIERLARVCRGVGAERLLAEGETLQREINFADETFAQRILGQREPALMPLARLILEKGGPIYRETVVAYLRKLELTADEPCLVRLFDSPADLPQDYLFSVMSSTTGSSYPPGLRARVAELLCAYVRQLGSAQPESPRRVYGIQLLAKFPSREAKQLLTEIVGSSKYLVIHNEPKPVRRAAKAVLAGMP